ncbi:toll-like receptor 4 isoform X1 [Haliotis rufescens]|uniref:toll-like receptor 4 isoform X1 n=2 Tax=Haliotis rufescens TaxID=6454 RepID=UPI00201E7B8F|nr:toll-like receptor 4 isoform X1 [Haliotis rufescens]
MHRRGAVSENDFVQWASWVSRRYQQHTNNITEGDIGHSHMDSVQGAMAYVYSLRLVVLQCWIYYLHAAVTTFCTPTFDGRYGGTLLNCSGLHLKSVPVNRGRNVTSLDLRNNQLQSLDNNSFISYPDLKGLQLDNNVINHMDSGAFSGIQGLETLSMKSNKLRMDTNTYPDDIFVPLINVKELHLKGNDAYAVGFTMIYPDKAFSKLVNLQYLSLDSSAKIVFKSGFEKLINLRTLVLGSSALYNDKENSCSLKEIANDTFSSFRSTNLSTLILDLCNLFHIETYAFEPLHNLSILSMEAVDWLNPTAAFKSLAGLRGRNMTLLNMRHVFVSGQMTQDELAMTMLTKETVQHLGDICVEVVDISDNQIYYIETAGLFDSLFSTCIKHFDLSDNRLIGRVSMYDLHKFSNLVYMDISVHVTSQNRFTSSGLLSSSLSRTPDGHYNVQLPKTLQAFNISNISTVGEVNAGIRCCNCTSLRVLDISFLEMNSFNYPLLGLEHLSEINLSGNDIRNIMGAFFDTFSGLRILKLNYVNADSLFLTTKGKSLFKKLTNLQNIHLTHSSIDFLPNDIFSENSDLKHIKLSNNNFKDIPFDLSHCPKLSSLDMAYNSISTLTPPERGMLQTLFQNNNMSLYLHGNILACGCSSIDFIEWLHSAPLNLDRDEYECVAENGSLTTTLTVFLNRTMVWRKCIGKLLLSVTLTITMLLGFVLVSSILVHMNWTKVQRYIIKALGLVNEEPQAKREDFHYDAYIGSSETDWIYVYGEMRDMLELRFGLRLFLHHRDTVPGGNIAEDIINGIHSSWRIVLVISQDFLDGDEDGWTKFITRRSVYACNNMDNRIIVLLLGDVNIGDLPEDLLEVVPEEHILEVEEDCDAFNPVYEQIRMLIMNR